MKQEAQTASRTCDPRVVADLLRAMAHPMRLTILCRLVDGEISVGGIESELGLKQPSLSQQLGLLREAGLVITRREAKSVVYGLADHRLNIVLDALRSFVSDGSTASSASMARPPAPLAAAVDPARVALQAQGQPEARPIHSVTNECGVFAEAGWPAGRGRKADDRRE
jgi:DNA-binding transcriptional ArsR family regulator